MIGLSGMREGTRLETQLDAVNLAVSDLVPFGNLADYPSA